MTRPLFIFFLLLSIKLAAFMPDDSGKLNLPQTSWVIFSAGYRLPVYTDQVINSGRGVCLEAGINPGRLISKTSLIGLYVGWGWKDNLWYSNFKPGFVKDYQSSINNEQPMHSLDSAIVQASTSLFSSKKGRSPNMPGCEMQSFKNYSLYYGIVVQLPWSFLPAVKIYRGSTRSHYQGPDGLITSGTDRNILQLRRSMYGVELLALNPFMLFYKKQAVPVYLQKFGLSCYFEYCDFYTSSLYFDNGEKQRNIPLKRFVTDKTLKKYAHENIFGFKISYNLY